MTARINQCHSYTDRFSPSHSRYFSINHQIAYFAFPLPALWTFICPLKCLTFDDISRAEGEPIIHQQLFSCLDDPKQFKLEYLRARARCSYHFYIIPELTSLSLPIETRVANATNSSRHFHLALLGMSSICEWPFFYPSHLSMMFFMDLPPDLDRCIRSEIDDKIRLFFYFSDLSIDCQFSGPVLTDVFIPG